MGVTHYCPVKEGGVESKVLKKGKWETEMGVTDLKYLLVLHSGCTLARRFSPN